MTFSAPTGQHLWDRLEKPFTHDDHGVASQDDAVAPRKCRPIEEVDNPRGVVHGNYRPSEWFPANVKTVLGEHATDWVPTRFETPSSGRRESLHGDRGLGVDKPSTRVAPSEQHGASD